MVEVSGTVRTTARPGLASARPGLTAAVSPHGHLLLEHGADEGASTGEALEKRLLSAYVRSAAALVLHLGASELGAELPAPLAFFREIGRLFVTRLARLPQVEERRAELSIAPPREELALLAGSAPPMKGLEYLTPESLEELWSGLNALVREELAHWPGDVASWLQSKDLVWTTVGRVVFHLAENRKSERTPFAFLATYATRVGEGARVAHLPLGRALKEYGAARDRETLLALLEPVQRASEKSAVVKGLVESGALFQPLAWTVPEAYRFLKEAAGLEECGVVVRLPDFWKGRARRPEVSVTVGARPAGSVGLDGLLDFSVELSLDGERLTEKERKEILSATAGLALVRGNWVEADGEKLRAVLDRWADARLENRSGVPFGEALRLVSGLDLGGRVRDEEDVQGWSRVLAGEWLANAMDGLRGPEALAAADPGSELRGTLRPYQKAGVKWLHALTRLGLGGCLADDMGLGKTIQVLALFLLLRRERKGETHLLVLPASLISNWKSEIERFAPSLNAFVAHGSAFPAADLAALPAGKLKGVDVVLTTYGSLLSLSWLKEIRWGLVVLDEAQAVKNPGAQQTRAAKALKSRLRLALTGTPVENRLGDLWSIFDFVAPGLLGSAAEFTRYAKRLAGSSTPDYGPLRGLVRPYVLRRMKTDRSVIADLPDKTEVKAWCPLSKTQAALYQQSVKELAKALEETQTDGMKRRGIVLSFLVRFKQICNHPSQWLSDGTFAPAASGKFGRLAEICEELRETQEKVLVFTQFREMTGPLSEYLATLYGRPGLVLHGGTPVGKRRALVDDFQREDGPPFFVVSLKAGGTGLNLTEASHVVHFDRWWNPAVEDQATDRAFRIGQKRNVLVHKLVCRGTVEERIDTLIEGKRELSRELLEGGGELNVTEMSNAELMRLVSLDLTAALGE